MERRVALEAAVPLKPEFRFAHEPLGSDAGVGFVGHDEDVHALAQRLLFSQGGSFLITGYRGVGKTSFVNQVIGEVSRVVRSKGLAAVCTDVVEVRLNLARALQPAELMHHIVRRLFDSLDEAGILEQLPPKVRRDLTLAYVRTSMNVSQKLATSTELAVGMPGIELGAAPFKMSSQGLFTRKSRLAHNEEASFLTYDDRAAEHDLIRLAQELTRGFEVHDGRIWRLARAILGRRKPTRRLKVVFVFDELDKLDTEIAPDAAQRSPIDELLNVLKTLFTTSGITFVFVAGKELQERWLEDVGRGDSVYESVFSYDRYLACIWSDSDHAATGNTDRCDPIDALCSRFVNWT